MYASLKTFETQRAALVHPVKNYVVSQLLSNDESPIMSGDTFCGADDLPFACQGIVGRPAFNHDHRWKIVFRKFRTFFGAPIGSILDLWLQEESGGEFHLIWLGAVVTPLPEAQQSRKSRHWMKIAPVKPIAPSHFGLR
jgi:hypothetical protein